ncbi:hypothetical protein VZQ01_41435 [Myxococcus faecalis]|uniref:hypothetical protein n=1 Tax=Myxococcus faecalis TaxID=3115646 RepID=UPI003CFB20CA
MKLKTMGRAMRKVIQVVFLSGIGVLSFGACGPAPEEAVFGGDDDLLPEYLGEVSQSEFGGDLGSRVSPTVAAYNTCGVSNQWRLSCNSGGTGDMAYIWKAPYSGAFVFSTLGSSFDTVLEVRNYKNTSQILGCNDDVGQYYQSRMTLSGIQKGDMLLIIVDGYEGDCGSGVLHIGRP